jgi:carboxylesterase
MGAGHRPPRRWRRWVLLGLLLAVGLVGLGDVIYSRVVASRLACWEATVARDPDGVRVGCREHTVGSGAPALLLVHGFGDSPAVYDQLAPALAAAGFTCRVMRLPGFAMPMADYAATSLAAWRGAFAAELQALRAGHEHIWVVGHSLGGAIAIDHLLEHPEAADGVVLLAPLLGVSGERSPVLSPRAWYEVSRYLLHATTVTETPYAIDATDPAALAYPYRDRFVPRAVYDSLFALTDHLEGQASRFRTPVLLVLARRDEVVDNVVAEAFLEEAAAPRRKLVVLEESGHAIPLDGERDRVVQAILAFTGVSPDRHD